jgi:MFS transporter, MHS family, proline/betaine transporter
VKLPQDGEPAPLADRHGDAVVPLRAAPASRLAVLAGMCGNVLEWYDFALVGVLAPTLGRVFFPAANRLVSLLAVFGVFATGYVMRLVGGLLLGQVADRFGRRRSLLLSVGAMTLGTLAVTLLPTYATAGIAAPLLFTALRLLQGVAVGGEFTTSIAFLIEAAGDRRRGLAASWAGFAATAGLLLGSAAARWLFARFGAAEIDAWAWRLPFALSLPLGAGLLLLRATLPADAAPPDAAREAASGAMPAAAPGGALDVLRQRAGLVLTGVALGWAPSVAFYMLAVFLSSYLSTEKLLPEAAALGLQTGALAAVTLLCPVMGALSDRLGRKPVVIGHALGVAALGWPLFEIAQARSPTRDAIVVVAFAAVVAAGPIPFATWLAERFPRHLRARGVGLGYNVAAGIGGGTTPLIATWLVEASGRPLAPALYLTGAAILTIAAALSQPETARSPLD